MGTAANFTCPGGSHLDYPYTANQIEATCKSDHTWSISPTPACLPTCTALSSTTTTFVYSNAPIYRFGSSVYFTCPSGFIMPAGSPVNASCGAERNWTETAPDCQAACPEETVSNGLFSTLDPERKAGTLANITCTAGFILTGDLEYNCTETGAWSPMPLGTCTMPCQELNVTNGDFISEDPEMKNGSWANVTCHPGYSPTASTQYECSNGAWDPEVGFCLANCPEEVVANGHFNIFDPERKVGTLANITCTAGFILARDLEYICTDTGAWSPMPLGTCTMSCQELNVTNGDFIYEDPEMKNGSWANLTCNPGYASTAGTQYECSNGAWDPEVGFCLANCPEEVVANGQFISFDPERKVGTGASITCSPGFMLAGSVEFNCTETESNAAWTPELGSCVATCQNQTIANGRFDTQDPELKTGTSANIVCDATFSLNGPAEYTCTDTGEWAPAPLASCQG